MFWDETFFSSHVDDQLQTILTKILLNRLQMLLKGWLYSWEKAKVVQAFALQWHDE